jgi:hypothetical protein
MRTGLFKKFTQRRPKEGHLVEMTLRLPNKLWYAIEDTVEDREGYTQEELSRKDPEADLINSIISRHFDTGGVDWISEEDMSK